MAKIAALGLGAVGALAAVWSGGWYYGEGQIREQLDAQIVEWAGHGVAASYKSLEIEGFPFAYRGKLIGPRTQSIVLTPQGQARADWETPIISFESSVADFGTVNFSVPEAQNARLTSLDGLVPPFDIVIRSNGFSGNLSKSGDQVNVSGQGEAIEVEVTSSLTPPYTITAEKLMAIGTAPDNAAGQMTGVLDLEGAAVNGDAWDIVDPSQSFPRDPVNIGLSAKADVSVRPDRTVQVDAIQIDRMALNLAGIILNGDGAAEVRDRKPEGAITLRLQGLGDFLENAARAGYLAEKDVKWYQTILGGFARKGEREGEQVYSVSFKNGFTFVNGAPTFMPAPQLP